MQYFVGPDGVNLASLRIPQLKDNEKICSLKEETVSSIAPLCMYD